MMNLDEFKHLILGCCTGDLNATRREREESYNSLIQQDIIGVIHLHLQNILELPSTVVQKTSAVLLKRLIFTTKNNQIDIFTNELVNEIHQILFSVFVNENYEETLRILTSDSLLLICIVSREKGFDIDFLSPLFELSKSEIPTLAATAIMSLSAFVDNQLIDINEFGEPITQLITTDLSVPQPAAIVIAIFRLVYSVSPLLDITPYIEVIKGALTTFEGEDLNTLLRDMLSYKTMVTGLFKNSAEGVVSSLIELIQNTELDVATRGLAIQVMGQVIETAPEEFVDDSEDIIGLLVDCIGEIDESFDPTVNVFVDSSIHSHAIVVLNRLGKVFNGYYTFFEQVIYRFLSLIEMNTFQSVVSAFNFVGCLSQSIALYHGLYFPKENMSIFMTAFSSDNDIISYASFQAFNEYLDAFSNMLDTNYSLDTNQFLDSLIEIASQRDSQALQQLIISVISKYISLFPDTVSASAERLVEYVFSMIDAENVDILCTIFDTLQITAHVLGPSYLPYADQTLEVSNEITSQGLESYEQDVYFTALKLYVSLFHVWDRERGIAAATEYFGLLVNLHWDEIGIKGKMIIKETLQMIMELFPQLFTDYFDFIFEQSMNVISHDYQSEHFEFTTNPNDLFDYEITISMEEHELIGFKVEDINNIVNSFDTLIILKKTCEEQFLSHNAEIVLKLIELRNKNISDKVNKYIVIFMVHLYPSLDPTFNPQLANITELSQEEQDKLRQMCLLCAQNSALAYSSLTNFECIYSSTIYFSRTIHYISKSTFIKQLNPEFVHHILLCMFKQMIASIEREYSIFYRNDKSVRIEYDLNVENSIQTSLLHSYRDLFKLYPEVVVATCTEECPLLRGKERSTIISYFPFEINTNGTKYHVNKSTFDFHAGFIAYASNYDNFGALVDFMQQALSLNLYAISHSIIECIAHLIFRVQDDDNVRTLLEIYSHALEIVRQSTLWAQIIYPTSKILIHFSEIVNIEQFAHAVIEPLQHFDQIEKLSEKKRQVVITALPIIESATTLTDEERALLQRFIEAITQETQ